MERKINWSNEFSREIRKLSRRYRRIDQDIESFHNEFLGGRLPGDLVRGVGGLPIKEHGMRDSSSNVGKRGGFRVYYYFDESQVLLLLIIRRSRLHTLSLSRVEGIMRNEGILD